MQDLKTVDIYWYNSSYVSTYNTVLVDGGGLAHGQYIENVEFCPSECFPTGID